MDPKDEWILYGYWRSSASWRVRLALNLKDVPWRSVPVNLLEGEQLKEPYDAINPAHLLPTLELPNGTKLTQSPAILEFLEESFPAIHPLLPSSPLDRALVRALMNMIACDIHPVQNLRVLKRIGPEKKAEWARHFITLGFEALEKALEKTSGKYCFKDSITMADLCLVPQVYNAHRFNVDMSVFPIITRINEILSQEEAFIRAHPSQQSDAVNS